MSNETLRVEFEALLGFTPERNDLGEYCHVGIFHMWDGFCKAANKYTIHSYLVEHVSGEAIYAKTIMAATDQKTELGWDDKDITWTWLYKKDE